MRADPGDAAQEQDYERRNSPDDELDRARVLPVWTIGGPSVARPEPPRKCQRQDNDRNDHGEHDGSCVEENDALRLANRTAWIEHTFTARGYQRSSANDADGPRPHLHNMCADTCRSPRASGVSRECVLRHISLHESQPRVAAWVRTIGFRCMQVSQQETKRSVYACARAC